MWLATRMNSQPYGKTIRCYRSRCHEKRGLRALRGRETISIRSLRARRHKPYPAVIDLDSQDVDDERRPSISSLFNGQGWVASCGHLFTSGLSKRSASATFPCATALWQLVAVHPPNAEMRQKIAPSRRFPGPMWLPCAWRTNRTTRWEASLFRALGS